MKHQLPVAALLLAFAFGTASAQTPSAAPKCKKGEIPVVVKDRVEGDKAVRLVLTDAKSGKVVADFETAKVFASDIAKYTKGAKVCHKEEGDH